MFSWGASTVQEIEALDRAEEEPESLDATAMSDDMGRRGQILWIRGLTRLQHQVNVTSHLSNLAMAAKYQGTMPKSSSSGLSPTDVKPRMRFSIPKSGSSGLSPTDGKTASPAKV